MIFSLRPWSALRRLTPDSVATRITLALSLVVLAAMSAIAFLSVDTFNAQLRSILYKEQDLLVDRMARGVDHHIELLQNALKVSASQIREEDLVDFAHAQEVLNRNHGLSAVFDRSVFLFSAQGKLVAERPYRTDRLGQDATWRPYIRKTLDTKQPVISEPFMTNTGDKSFVVVLTMPVLSKDGQLLGLLTGSLGLSRPELLGDIEKTTVGQTGSVFITTADGKVLMAKDKQLLSKPLFARGQNELFDRALSGFEGSGQSVDNLGRPVFVAYKRLKSAGWVLSSTYPVEEAQDYVKPLLRQFLMVLFVSLAMALTVTWVLARRILSPLRELIDHIAAYTSSQGRVEALQLTGGAREMRSLITAFNALTHRLNEREDALIAAMSQYKVITEASTDLITKHDAEGAVTYASPSSATVLGLEASGVLGSRTWFERVHPEDTGHVQQVFLDVGRGAPPITLSYRALHATDGYVWLESVMGVLPGENGRCEILCVSRNIDERKSLELRLYREARIDGLTGLPNRLMLDERLSEAIDRARRQESRVAALLVDIDRFKEINDTLGHHSGDEIISCVSERLRACARDDETIARWGGDEFVIVLPDLRTPGAAEAFAHRCLKALAAPVEYQGLQLRVTASIGIALLDAEVTTSETLVANADIAMYRAKQQGGNMAVTYSRDMSEGAHRRLSMENALFGAAQRNELELHYQPLVCARTGKVTGVEALMRWEHPLFGRVSPGLFIPMAEKNGAIIELGTWAMQTACRQMAEWRKMGHEGLTLSVNVSGRQFMGGEILHVVHHALESSGLPAGCLQIEITESVLMQDVQAHLDLVSRIKDLGVSIALDDFGTGYSSLSYIKRFELDVIKLDKSFTDEMLDNHQTHAIVRATFDMARSLGLRTVAEGVETLPQAKALAELGCDRLQGYYFARPMPAGDVLAYFKSAPIYLIGRNTPETAAV